MKLTLNISPVQWLQRGEREVAINTFEALSARSFGNRPRASRTPSGRKNFLVEKGIVSVVESRPRRIQDFEPPRFIRDSQARRASLQAEWDAAEREAKKTSDLILAWRKFIEQAESSGSKPNQLSQDKNALAWVEE